MCEEYQKSAVNEYRSIYHFRAEFEDLRSGLTIGLWQDVLPGHWTYEAAFKEFREEYEKRHPGIVDWPGVQVTHVPF